MRFETISCKQLKKVYQRIQQDFPINEYAPYSKMYEYIRDGLIEGILFFEGSQPIAYVFCQFGQQHQTVLCSLFAVFSEYRGQGFGTKILSQLIYHYREYQAIYLEVELPQAAADQKDYLIRQKRISFYQRCGFQLINSIESYRLWNVDYCIMAVAIQASFKTLNLSAKQHLIDIYNPILGEQNIHRLCIKP